MHAPVLAQADCANVVIESVHYSALYPSVIEVSAYYDGSDCIDYPSFILFDGNGDTLAIESVNFFCVGFGSPMTHPMTILADAVVPTGSFNAHLELYSGFGDTLVCSWDLSDVVLCPPAECQQAEIYTNTGDLEAFTAYWWITDENGNWMDQGTFEVDDIQHTHYDTTCLVPGSYELGFSPFSPIDEEFVIGITPSYNQSIGFNTWLDESESLGTCPSPGMRHALMVAIRSRRMTGTSYCYGWNRRLHLAEPDGRPLGDIRIYSIDGRLARSLQALTDRVTVDLNGLATGLHVVRVLRPEGHVTVQTIIIP
ncbi:MAG: T9SS type A sorting domain-containing protein [Flavobacteriales bacterium]